jgi:hypothetical protein
VALTLVPIPTAGANSYVSLAQAVAYFEGRVGAAAWVAAGTSAREQALVSATARLEQEHWLGEQVTSGQPLAWPRLYVLNDDRTAEYDGTSAPPRLVAATCELALALLSASGDPLGATGLEGFARVKIGPLEVTPNTTAFRAGELPPNVRRSLAPLLATGGSGTFRVVRS